MNHNVIVKNESLSKTTNSQKWTQFKQLLVHARKGRTKPSTLAMRHMEFPLETLFVMDWIPTYQRYRGNFWSQTSGTETMMWHLVTLPMLTGLMRKLRLKRYGYACLDIASGSYGPQSDGCRAQYFLPLPFFRFNGDAGMRTVSADISRDEQIHVASNSIVCRELGLDISPAWTDSAKQQ